MSIKRLIRAVLPGALVEPWVQRFHRVRWEGDYADWAAARRDSTGYESEGILKTVLGATREVRDGRARYERDGVVFAGEPAPWPALDHLRRLAVTNGGRLHVLDFGGSLGSTYFQHRRSLAGARVLRWDVVEQPLFVAAGRREIQTEELRFFPNVDEVLATGEPGVLLLSNVMQFLENPHQVLEEFLRRPWPLVIVDWVPLHSGSRDRLTVQRVPRNIYRASYPAWFFNRERLLAHFSGSYELLAEFPNGEPAPGGFKFTGFVFRRLSP